MVHISEIQLPQFKKHISNKLGDYIRRDKKLCSSNGNTEQTITPTQCIKLVEESDGSCKMCNCEMLFVDYTPHCLYQFTFDRLDESRPHTVDNLRIICYSCNSTGNVSKVNCINGCHGVNAVKIVKPDNHNTKWSKQDDILMFESLLNNIDISVIANNLNRTQRSIDKRLYRLFHKNMSKLNSVVPAENHKFISDLYWYNVSNIKTYSESDLIQSRKIIDLVMSYWDYSKA